MGHGRQEQRQSDGVEIQPKWRLFLGCFGSQFYRQHKIKNHGKHRSECVTPPRTDNLSLTSYEGSSYSRPILDSHSRSKRKTMANKPSRSHLHNIEGPDPFSSTASQHGKQVACTQLNEFMNLQQKQRREAVCVDDYTDAASTYYVDLKNDADRSIISSLTTPRELESRLVRLGASPEAEPPRQHAPTATTVPTTTPRRPFHPPSTPKNSAESVSLRSLFYDYHGSDEKSTASSTCSSRKTSYSAQALALQQRETTNVCWL